MKVPHPIPYQGSKRNIAKYILMFFPYKIQRLLEPFAGSAAVTIAAASHGKASRFFLNDINKPLIDLWQEIINHPQEIADEYERLWNEQKGREKEFYYGIRDEFNKTGAPGHFLYLLARCVKASVRYNAQGEFNQSPDNRRKGRHPKQMREDIFAVSNLLKGRTELASKDYKEILQQIGDDNLVYMDPPYQGVCSNGDPRYFMGVKLEELLRILELLNQRNVPYILSYDGRTGSKSYGQDIPGELGLHRIEIKAGRSAQATLLGKKAITYESLYLSPGLLERLEADSIPTVLGEEREKQLHLALGD